MPIRAARHSHFLGTGCMSDADKLNAIVALCRSHAHAGFNTGAHALANRVLAIAEPEGPHAAVVVASEEPERLGPVVHVHPHIPEE